MKNNKKYNNINATNRPTALFMRINSIIGLSEHLQSAVPSLRHKYQALIYCHFVGNRTQYRPIVLSIMNGHIKNGTGRARKFWLITNKWAFCQSSAGTLYIQLATMSK